MRQLSILLLLGIGLGSAHGFYSPSDDVVVLTPDNFESEVLGDNATWVLQFYAPWCRYSRKMVPEYKALATAFKGVVKVGAINADVHESLSRQFGVEAYPTIKIWGDKRHAPTGYYGQQTAMAIADAIRALATPGYPPMFSNPHMEQSTYGRL
ncbi:hypothetical protein KR018_003822 [Drosophila ironensis]|nr:hypothetical protein KR018_003822 [Drosophila ironensis]